MPKRLNPSEGGAETPVDHVALLQELEDGLLASKDPKGAVPSAVPETGAATVKAAETIEREKKIIAELERQRDMWMARVQAVATKKDFDTLTSQAAANGKYTVDSGPCFVVGRPLISLFQQHGVAAGSEADALKQKAYAVQSEIATVYLAKRAELYPSKTGPKKNAASTPPTPEPVSGGASGEPTEAEIRDYIAGLDAQVTDENLRTPFTRPNEARAAELSESSVIPPLDTQATAPASGKPEPVLSPEVATSPEAAAAEESFSLPRRMRIDQRVRIITADGSVYEIVKKSGGYRISKEGEPGIASIAKKDILKRAEAEGWRLAPKASSSQDGSPTEGAEIPPAGSSAERVAWAANLVEGKRYPFWNSAREELIVERKGDRYQCTNTNVGITSGFIYTAKQIEDTVADGGWRQVDDPLSSDSGNDADQSRSSSDTSDPMPSGTEPGSRSTEGANPGTEAGSTEPRGPAQEQPPRETVRLVDVDGVHIPENEMTAADKDARIAKLREAVAAERSAFIAVEESQKSSWKNLTRIFRGLHHQDGEEDEVAKYRAWYDEKILVLQNAELEKIKTSGLSIKEQRPMMAALIREFEFDEAERIYDTRQEIRLGKIQRPLLEKMKALWNETAPDLAPESGATVGEMWRARVKLMIGGTVVLGETAVLGIEKLGAGYNKLAKGKAGKYLLGATVAGAGAVGLGLATGGVGTAAVGLLALKRLAAGAGVSVTIETIAEGIAKNNRVVRRNRVEKDHEAMFDEMEKEEAIDVKLEEKESVDYSKLEAYLKKVSSEARRGEGARRRNELFRKSAAVFTGAALGSGAASHFLGQYIGSGSQAHAGTIPRDIAGRVIVGSDMAPDQAGATLAGPGPVAGNIPAEQLQAPRIPEGLKDTRAIPIPTEIAGPSVGVKEFLSTHEVKRGESIWKLATKAAQGMPGMDDRSSERFAKLVEVKLQTKLEGSPDLARAAGFAPDADGKFSPHHIQKGATLEIGKLISTDEMAKLIEEAKGSTPIVAPVETHLSGVRPADVVRLSSPVEAGVVQPTEAEFIAGEEARIDKKIPIPSADEKAAIIATFPESPTTELIKPTGNVMKYIETLPREEQEKLFRNFKKISVELFQTNEVMGGEVYDMRYDPALHPEFSQAKISTVIGDHKLLGKNPFMTYDRLKNPLHGSQMQEVAKFSKAAVKAFGESVATPKTSESVQEYVLRMVAIGRNQGVKIPGFRMLD